MIEPFSPLDIEIAAARYSYHSHSFRLSTDNSKKIFATASYAFGGYFNGKINTINASIRYVPDPHASITISLNKNNIRKLGNKQESITTDLLTTEIRLALNPRLQWTTFMQYNSINKGYTVNSRVQWEFMPLSFLFIVWNANQFDERNLVTQEVSRFATNQGVLKLSYLKQF